MADLVKVKLLRPLDGKAEGATAEYSKTDADRLEARGVVKIISAKAEPSAPENKMEAAPANKSEPIRKARK